MVATRSIWANVADKLCAVLGNSRPISPQIGWESPNLRSSLAALGPRNSRAHCHNWPGIGQLWADLGRIWRPIAAPFRPDLGATRSGGPRMILERTLSSKDAREWCARPKLGEAAPNSAWARRQSNWIRPTLGWAPWGLVPGHCRRCGRGDLRARASDAADPNVRGGKSEQELNICASTTV